MQSARPAVRQNQPVFGFDWRAFFRTMAMRGVLVAALGAAGSSTAGAADKTWTGASNTLWGNSANWSGGIPTFADLAIFGNAGFGGTVNLDTNRAVGGLKFNNTVNTTINSSSQTLTTTNALNPECYVEVVGGTHAIKGTSGNGLMRCAAASAEAEE